MIQTYTKLLNGASIGSLTGIAILLAVSNYVVLTHTVESLHSAAGEEPVLSQSGSSAVLPEAQELQKKLAESGSMVPSVTTLAHALEKKEELMKASVTITTTDTKNSAAPAATWTVSVADHPELVALDTQWSAASYGVDENMLADLINKRAFEGQNSVTSIWIAETESDGKVTRAKGLPIARDGYLYSSRAVAHTIATALEEGRTTVALQAPYQKGDVTLSMNGIKKNLQLLSSGESDYSDSPDERVWNVHKAIEERINNIIVKPGESFSFVDTLGGPVTLDKGWKEGLGLFGGGAALTPGAGICQAATTVFRAALLAGFPILEKRNHSMWVPHYEPFGAGLDATIFPGVHDMRFKNDSTSTILIQAYTHGDQVTVNFYGTSDNREVNLDGPYFFNTKPRASALSPLGKDQIGWVYTVKYADGKTVEKPLVATYYKGIPHSVMTKYAGVPGMRIMHELINPPVATTTH